MSVTTTGNRVTYTGNGVSTVFAFPYLFLANTDLVVIANGVVQTLGYTVAGAADPNGGNVTFLVAPAAAIPIIIYRDPDLLQQTVLSPNDPFPAKTVERMSDKLTLIAQRIKEIYDRSFRLSDADSTTASTTLPTPAANALIAWNSTASGLQNVDPATLAGIVTYGTWTSQTFNGDGVTTDFVLTSDPSTAANVDATVGGVPQRTNIDYALVAPLTIRISPAPPVGVNNVFFRWGSSLPLGVASSVAGQTSIGTQLIQAVSAASARTVIGAVGLTGNEVVAGIKNFTDSPIVPIATTPGQAVNKEQLDAFVTPKYLTGLAMSTAGSSTTMSIASGIAASSDDTTMMTLASAISKTTGAWAVGTGNGGKLSAAAIANNTWYYFWEIKRPDTGVVDVGFDVSPTVPTLPTNYTKSRYIGAALTNGSAQWVKFTQTGDDFAWDTPVLDFNGAGATSASLLLCSVPRRKVRAQFNVQAGAGGSVAVYFSDPANADLAPSITAAPLSQVNAAANGGSIAACWTNTSAQVRHRELSTNGLYIATTGWIDRRGRDD